MYLLDLSFFWPFMLSSSSSSCCIDLHPHNLQLPNLVLVNMASRCVIFHHSIIPTYDTPRTLSSNSYSSWENSSLSNDTIISTGDLIGSNLIGGFIQHIESFVATSYWIIECSRTSFWLLFSTLTFIKLL